MENRRLIACFPLLLMWAPAFAGDRLAVAPSLWKYGDLWTIDAQYYAPGKDAAVKIRLEASVAEDAKIDGKACRLIAIGADGDLPDGSKTVIHASIDVATGWPAKIVQLDGPFQAKLLDFGGRRVMAEAMEFFPVECFFPAAPGEIKSEAHRLDVTHEKADGQTKVVMLLSENSAELWRVEQIWRDREIFWRSYEKYLKGRLTLKATCTLHEAAERTEAEKARIAGLKTTAEEIDEENARRRAAHPLREDKRLWALVQVLPNRPAIAHVLRRLKEATGLDIEIDVGLVKHVPDLGVILPDAKGYPAWRLMEHLAKTEIADARWEKTEAGYRLTGASTVPPDRVLETSDDQPPARRFPWAWTAGALASALTVGGIVVIYRRRRSKA